MNRSDVMRAAREAGVHALEASDALAPFLERFAALVRAQVIEEAAMVCDRLTTALDHGGNEYRREASASQCAAALRGMKSDSGHSVSSVAEASTAPLPEGIDAHSYRQQTDREYRDEIGKSMEATLRAAAERVLGPTCDAAPACPCFDKRGVQLTKCFWGAPRCRSVDNVSPEPNDLVLDVPESAGAAERGER